MEELFVSHQQAVALREELEFNEPCLAYWNFYTREFNYNSNPSTFHSEDVIQLPLKQQVFKFFREKYDLFYDVSIIGVTAADKSGSRYKWDVYNYSFIEGDSEIIGYLTYEEAEDACIDKLLELAKEK